MAEALQHAALPAHEQLTGARRRLFEAALEQFGAHGYHAVSVKDLMTTLGQQPGALYFHVQSKQHLLLELVTIGTEFHRARIRQALLDASSDPVDQVHHIIEAHVRVHLEYRDLARIANSELRSLTDEQQAKEQMAREETGRIFQEVVERGIRLGAFTVEVPEIAIHAIASMGVRAAEWWTPESSWSIDEVARHYADYAIKILR